MDHDQTQPFKNETKVLYLCSCGTELSLVADLGGTCHVCNKHISPRALNHELAMTMTIQLEKETHLTSGGSGADSTTTVPADDDANQLIGKTLGHFEIVDTLGRGGNGQVYRALDKSLQRFVAVKVLRSGIGSTLTTQSTDEEIDALLQEAVSQARVTHPNIVTIYYVGKQDGEPFLAMELVNGNALSNLISAESLTFSHIAPIAIQISRALQFSHELDIIHGDIKPSNILIQENGLTKLSDFGMARRASDENTGRIGGTPNYIAPELLHGEKPTIQSDMYALGVTLYEMTFGRLPVVLSGNTVPDWIDSHNETKIHFPSPWPDNFPEQWKNILTRLLNRSPETRYEDYGELLDDLDACRPESRILARRTPRLIAAAIDWLTVFLFIAPVQFAIEIFDQFFAEHPVLEFMFQLSDFIPVAVYTTVVFFWRHSLGRRLMQVRVVNKHGLLPSRKTMATRSLLRMIGPWIACILLAFFDLTADGWQAVVGTTIFVLAIVYCLLDIAFLFAYQYVQSLHDIIFRTRVVVDTD